MRVLSWNIHCLRGGASRVGAIADAIAGHDPDVVALQEVSVEKGFPEVLSGALADRGLAGCAFGRPPEGARKRYGNVVASRWEVHSPDVGPVVDDESRHWRHLVLSALVTPASGGDVLVFSVHMPNGSGNGWAKIDAFEALAAAVAGRTAPTCVVAGDFNEPFRFDDGSAVSFAYHHGEQPDQLWARRGRHDTAAREYPPGGDEEFGRIRIGCDDQGRRPPITGDLARTRRWFYVGPPVP